MLRQKILTAMVPKEDKTDNFDKFPKKHLLPYRNVGSRTTNMEKVLRNEGIKRIIDILGAIVGLVSFSPILALSIVLIYLSGSKKIFFRQERVGRFGKRFMLYKFTTMKDNAHIDSPLVSRSGDVRITKIGKFLRMSSVNELPQFINVLKGEMSIVGPRPEVAKYVNYWSPEIKKRVLSVKPGITGYATTQYWKEGEILTRMNNYEEYYINHVMPEKLQLDLWYINNWNLILDIRIMFQTIFKAFNGDRKERPELHNPRYVKNIQFRHQPRIPVDIVACLEADNKSVEFVTVKNISSGGLFVEMDVETDEFFRIGTKINLNFKLPNRANPIKALCEIKWTTTKSTYKKTKGIGVRFIEVLASEESELKNYLESRFLGFG